MQVDQDSDSGSQVGPPARQSSRSARSYRSKRSRITRRRICHSCQTCRRRKVKCDKVSPVFHLHCVLILTKSRCIRYAETVRKLRPRAPTTTNHAKMTSEPVLVSCERRYQTRWRKMRIGARAIFSHRNRRQISAQLKPSWPNLHRLLSSCRRIAVL